MSEIYLTIEGNTIDVSQDAAEKELIEELIAVGREALQGRLHPILEASNRDIEEKWAKRGEPDEQTFQVPDPQTGELRKVTYRRVRDVLSYWNSFENYWANRVGGFHDERKVARRKSVETSSYLIGQDIAGRLSIQEGKARRGNYLDEVHELAFTKFKDLKACSEATGLPIEQLQRSLAFHEDLPADVLDAALRKAGHRLGLQTRIPDNELANIVVEQREAPAHAKIAASFQEELRELIASFGSEEAFLENTGLTPKELDAALKLDASFSITAFDEKLHASKHAIGIVRLDRETRSVVQ